MIRVGVDIGGEPEVRRVLRSPAFGTFAATEASRLMQRFVPFRDGALRASAHPEPFAVTYSTPYARRMYYGRNLRFRTPGTGAEWDQRIAVDALAASLGAYLRR